MFAGYTKKGGESKARVSDPTSVIIRSQVALWMNRHVNLATGAPNAEASRTRKVL